MQGLLHFSSPFRGSAIGSTPAFGAGYPGSSPGPGATFSIARKNFASACSLIRENRLPAIEERANVVHTDLFGGFKFALFLAGNQLA
jgi:hypothetical protein